MPRSPPPAGPPGAAAAAMGSPPPPPLRLLLVFLSILLPLLLSLSLLAGIAAGAGTRRARELGKRGGRSLPHVEGLRWALACRAPWYLPRSAAAGRIAASNMSPFSPPPR